MFNIQETEVSFGVAECEQPPFSHHAGPDYEGDQDETSGLGNITDDEVYIT